MSGWGSSIEIDLIPQGSAAARGALVAVQGREIDLSLDASGPRLGLAERVLLCFRGDGLTRKLEVPARVLCRQEAAPERIYRLQLEGEIEEQLKHCLRRRDAFRVRPDARTGISLCLSPIDGPREGGDAPLEAELVDISLHGLSLRIAPDQEMALREVDRVRVELQLPEAPAVLALCGLLVRRQLLAGAVVLGVEIESSETLAASEVEEQLTRYVVRRQMEQLR